MHKIVVALFAICLCNSAFAAMVTLLGTQITKVYTQSRQDSTAHLIQVGQTLPSSCSSGWNRAYIDFDDKELYSAALASYLAGKNIDVIIETNVATKLAAMHDYVTCRVVSIF